jgi:hypothetical protein
VTEGGSCLSFPAIGLSLGRTIRCLNDDRIGIGAIASGERV